MRASTMEEMKKEIEVFNEREKIGEIKSGSEGEVESKKITVAKLTKEEVEPEVQPETKNKVSKNKRSVKSTKRKSPQKFSGYVR